MATMAQPGPSTSASAMAQPGPSTQQRSVAVQPPAERSPESDMIYVTRPQQLQSKKGTDGQPVRLQTNYFKVLRRPQWDLFQYHVEFEPLIFLPGLRKMLIAQHQERLGGYLFTGSEIYLTKKADPEKDQIELSSESREGDKYTVKMVLVSTVAMQTELSLQILNVILRKAMHGLKLQLVGRNFFDSVAKVLERIWPSILMLK